MKTTLSILCLFLAFAVSGQSKEGDFHLDKEYKISPSGTISLSSDDAKVYITGSSRKTAHVKIDHVVTTKGMTFGHSEFGVDVSEENGDLEIKEHSNSVSVGIIGYYNEKYTITLEVPEGVSLKIKGDDGDYWIKNVGGDLSLDVDDADVELMHCFGSKFAFRLDDGDIKMDEGKGSLEIDADDADIEIRNAKFSFIDAKVDDGDLVIETSLVDDGQYYINGQDGLISLAVTKGGGRFDIRHDDGRITTEGDFSTVEDSDNHTKLTLASGSAKVEIRADDARVKLIKR